MHFALLQQTATSTEELNQTVRLPAGIERQAATPVTASSLFAERGGRVVSRVVATMCLNRCMASFGWLYARPTGSFGAASSADQMSPMGRVQPTERVERTAGHCRVADARDERCDGSFMAGKVS
jgi:hypothetical protein